MEIRAGLRCAEGRDRMRSRSASPSVQAVVEVKEVKSIEGLDSRPASSLGYICTLFVS